MTVEYKTIEGIEFRRYPNARNASDRTYFHIMGCNNRKLYAHRYVWEKYNGEIPEGWHIHHIDRDVTNNSLDNLDCMPAKDHREIHADDDRDSDADKRRMDYAREFASDWHKSDEGRAKHKEIGFIAWERFTPADLVCDQCGTSFKSRNLNYTERFCSNPCKSAWRRDSGIDDVTRICPCCDSEFTVNKYSKKECCGKSCMMVMRHRRKREA